MKEYEKLLAVNSKRQVQFLRSEHLLMNGVLANMLYRVLRDLRFEICMSPV